MVGGYELANTIISVVFTNYEEGVVEVIIFALVMGEIPRMIANSKGKSFFPWFVLAY